MNRTEKEQMVATLKKELADVEALFLADYRGLTVEEVNRVRREFAAGGCRYQVVKNTLLKLALAGTEKEDLGELLQGPTVMTYSPEDPLQPAKILAKFAKELEALQIKGGFYEGVQTPDDVDLLSKMPGKNELRAMLLATMLAVPQGLLRLMLAAPQRLMLVLEARKRSLEG